MTAGFSVTAGAGAAGYDRVMDALAPPEATDAVLSGVVRPDDVVLDVGCGTGRATRAIAARARAVLALDLSTDMLERFAARGVPGNVELRAGDVTDPAVVEPRSVDLVTCLLGGLQYVQDLGTQARVVRNMRRWLRPGGRVAVEMFERSAYDALLGSHRLPLVLDGVHWWLRMDVSHDGQIYTSVSSVHRDGREDEAAGFTEVFRPTDVDEAFALMAGAGFESVAVQPDLANRGFLWVSAVTPENDRNDRNDNDSHRGGRATPAPHEERNRA
ncbi:class I SAM-dependent methyltransferase [Mycetocola reblochoni]|uniref:class I SAM-dependent methyltransferase n=1 Tax=Mycetocola reblochoni TaxID=331618 RepID=UPI003F94D0BB